MKLYNSSTKMCRKTLLGPTFGSPLRRSHVHTLSRTPNSLTYPLFRLSVLPAPIHYSESGDETRRYLVYTTTDKVQKYNKNSTIFIYICVQVGLLLLPHDGNPHNTTCLTAHPGLVCIHLNSCVTVVHPSIHP